MLKYLSLNNIKKIFYVIMADGYKSFFHIVKEIFMRYWYVERHGLKYTKNKISITELNKEVNSKMYEEFGVEYGISQFNWLKLGVNGLPINLKNSTILDIGSGEGIPLCYFAQVGFKELIGIEYSKNLVKTSRKNLEIIKKKYNNISWNIINGNAYDYQIPDKVNVIYMFNPFFGDLLNAVLKNIQKAGESKTIFILFANPPKENITKKYLIKVKEIRKDYPRVFLYKTKSINKNKNGM